MNSGASERLAVPASCATPAMLFIVNDMYIEYSGFHTNGFNQEDTHICFTHYNFAQYFQDIIYWTQPIKTSSFCGKKNFASSFSKKKKKKKFARRLTIFVWKIRRTRNFFGVALTVLIAFYNLQVLKHCFGIYIRYKYTE